MIDLEKGLKTYEVESSTDSIWSSSVQRITQTFENYLEDVDTYLDISEILKSMGKWRTARSGYFGG